jgi:hypothetical protein
MYCTTSHLLEAAAAEAECSFIENMVYLRLYTAIHDVVLILSVSPDVTDWYAAVIRHKCATVALYDILEK